MAKKTSSTDEGQRTQFDLEAEAAARSEIIETERIRTWTVEAQELVPSEAPAVVKKGQRELLFQAVQSLNDAQALVAQILGQAPEFSNASTKILEAADWLGRGLYRLS